MENIPKRSFRHSVTERSHWIFDMDGTLTVGVHNFKLIREKLGIPIGAPILETIEDFPKREATIALNTLEKIEYELAVRSKPQNGVHDLLKLLRYQNKKLGIITRNSIPNSLETLKNCNLNVFFYREFIVGRESCKPKPSPDGIYRLLQLWNAFPGDTILVGDYLFDLIAGRKAGVFTIYLDCKQEFKWKEYADLCVSGLHDIIHLLRCGN